ncbi:aminoglycoside phosphotransferase (APT) family kinase protein [Williamsia limnetica]|uniref:Aminoglycoside phosphotransferase (APT) family kinase protein n=1 Tax=Williamsia limnetica TaxID=882452 RepID=A0A318RKA6_WILLI|nr:phosphotransferase family protein [Williamsia limnetica]PYE14365.1 aminoglycoside phosphotransferase (APT) family kinase protein [Williamsia limnetica]
MYTVEVDLDLPRLAEWLKAEHSNLGRPVKAWLLAGGRSNITIGLETAAGERYCLRRPPGGDVAQSHNIEREYRFLERLQASGLPVPAMLAYCGDRSVAGAPFFMMRFVEGTLCGDASDATQLSDRMRWATGHSMAPTLAQLHGIDLVGTGVGDLARQEDFIGRQLRAMRRGLQPNDLERWPQFAAIETALMTQRPAETEVTLVHGDFKMGNCIFADDGSIAAVLDWELATLGSPLADVGWLVASWRPPGDTEPRILQAPSTVEGFPGVDEILSAYQKATGRELADLPYFVGLAEWKWACISVGIHRRYRQELMGAATVDLTILEREIDSRLAAAEAALR